MDWLLDNGSGVIKTSAGSAFASIENAVLATPSGHRVGFSDEFDDLSDLYWSRPCEQEFMTDPSQQLHIWRHLQEKLKVQKGCNFVCSIPLNNFPAINDALAELAFEELDCDSVALVPSPVLASFALKGRAHLLVDIGFAATRICAVYDNEVIPESIIRLQVGGRVMTNYLKDIVSYRHVNVSNQQYLVDELKCKTIHVVDDYVQALSDAKQKNPARNPYMVDYLLPDYAERLHGEVLPREEMGLTTPKPGFGKQIIRLTNETFAPAELLFSPRDIGIDAAGLHECIASSLQQSPDWIRPLLARNIVLIGGGASIPGLQDRLDKELQSLLPSELRPLRVIIPERPDLAVWRGSCAFKKKRKAIRAMYIANRVTYEEAGSWSALDSD
eukprot:m.34492 g.34492  ORF g.34492 m.34492 type:complete len:386 (+) comp11026_c0_seq1:159-1316(+)